MQTLKIKQKELEQTFKELTKQWHQETGMMSLISQIVEHSAYQKIIALGKPVIPLILRELEKEPDHWLTALRQITGVNPVKLEQQGIMKEMAQSWLEWGKQNGYEW